MDSSEAPKLIDSTIDAIDKYHVTYRRAVDREGHDNALWEAARKEEHSSVIPQLDLARQIASHLQFDDLDITAAPNKGMYKSWPYEANRAALITLRSRVTERERMEQILGPTGPQLSSAHLHPVIWHAAAPLFDGGHYRQAAQAAGQALEGHLQAIAGPKISGKDLAKLFATSGTGTRLHFPVVDDGSKSYMSAIEGAASLIRGAMMAIRNLVSHPDWPDPTESEALEMLAVLSYIANLVDKAETVD